LVSDSTGNVGGGGEKRREKTRNEIAKEREQCSLVSGIKVKGEEDMRI